MTYIINVLKSDYNLSQNVYEIDYLFLSISILNYSLYYSQDIHKI